MSESKKSAYIARVSVLKIFEATSFEAIKTAKNREAKRSRLVSR